MAIDIEQVEQWTAEHGGDWPVPHAQRLIALVRRISTGIAYDAECIHWAAYLHDWGAFPGYQRAGCLHPLRSREIAETEILPGTNFTPLQKEIILEAIELHDFRDSRSPRSVEARLLREADGLDLLGVLGMAREFAWGPNNLAAVVDRIRLRMEQIPACLTIPAAREIAAERIVHVQAALAALQEESGGVL